MLKAVTPAAAASVRPVGGSTASATRLSTPCRVATSWRLARQASHRLALTPVNSSR